MYTCITKNMKEVFALGTIRQILRIFDLDLDAKVISVFRDSSCKLNIIDSLC